MAISVLGPILGATLYWGDKQWGFGYFTAPGLVSCVLPITADTVLAVLAIDDVGSPGAGVIGWVTSQTDGQQVTFGCDVNISRFVYAAICR